MASLPRSGVGNQQCRARDPDPSPVDLVLAVLHEVRQLGDVGRDPPPSKVVYTAPEEERGALSFVRQSGGCLKF